MANFAYLFERFPSFGQTFCYREVAELDRQGVASPIFSIRNPKDEPPQEWDTRIIERVHYVPEEKELLNDVRSASKKRKLTPEIVAALDDWGRRTDFLRLYQAVYVGLRLHELGARHVHAHFAGMAARTAFWIHRFFPMTFSFTAHANDIFAPRHFEIGLDKLVDVARVIVTETDYAAQFLRERFPQRANSVHRIYNGLDLAEFERADFSSTPPLIIAVGRLIAKKGFAELIRACCKIALCYPVRNRSAKSASILPRRAFSYCRVCSIPREGWTTFQQSSWKRWRQAYRSSRPTSPGSPRWWYKMKQVFSYNQPIQLHWPKRLKT